MSMSRKVLIKVTLIALFVQSLLGDSIFGMENNKVMAESIVVIVYNDDEGFTTDSPWVIGQGVGYTQSSRYYHDGSTGADPAKWAQFTPDIPVEGYYTISMWVPPFGTRPEAAPLEIKYRDGISTDLTINQKANSNKWVKIGTFLLSEGTENYLKLLASDAGTTLADAVKFEWVAEAETPDPSPTSTSSPSSTPSPVPSPTPTTSPSIPPENATVIVYNDDEGFTTDSPWVVGQGVGGTQSSRYYHDGSAGANPTKWAMFTPDIPVEGNYIISMWVPPHGTRPEAAPLEIKHRDGIRTDFTINQRDDRNKWVEIGVFSLAQGTDNYLKILASHPGYTLADAVKFEWTTKEVTPAPTPTTAPTATPSPGQTTPIAPGLDGDLAERFPVYQVSVNKVLTGDNRGVGVLAQYDGSGPQEVYLSRTTQTPTFEPFVPTAYAKVFDPDGNMVLLHDFSNQLSGKQVEILTIPSGQPGIWTVSFTGGREGDILEIGLPETDVWGVRGEMALGITETTPKTAYIYLADITQQNQLPTFMPNLGKGYFFLEAFGNAPHVTLRNKTGAVAGNLANVGGRNVIQLESTPVNEVWSLDLNGFGGYIVIDGTPALLAPTAEAALALKGGTVEAEGFIMPGKLQARLREKMVELAEQSLEVELDFPEEVPLDLANPRMEALLYGKYGSLQGLDYAFEHQILDKDDPGFGMILDYDPARPVKNQYSSFAGAMAAAVAVPGQMNPAYENEALLKRAVLNSMSLLAWLQGDFTYKDSDLRDLPVPSTNYFIMVGPMVVDPFLLLHDKVDPETAALWEEAVTAFLDKNADTRSFLSNQWSHNILAQLYMYEATGETRFLRNFEKMAAAFMDGAHGASSKLMGLHPTGFYMENFGPDGNYDSLSSFHMVASYLVYKESIAADPVILEKLRAGIEKNLYFKSFYWLPQPDGSMASPTAINTRTNTPIHQATYPGDIMMRSEMPLSLTRYSMWPGPSADLEDLAGGDIMAHRINTDEWALKVLRALLPLGSGAYDTISYWPHIIYSAFSKPVAIEPAALPIDSEFGTWELPGQVAWKRGPLYGVVFYDVTGVSGKIPQAKFGGGPTVMWGEGTGSVVSSLRNNKNGTVTSPSDMTHSGVFGKDHNGKFFYTGEERTSLTWIVQDEIFELRTPLAAPKGELVWRYELGEQQTLIKVSLQLEEEAQESYVNLPVASGVAGTEPAVFGDNTLIYQAGNSSMRIEWPADAAAQLQEEVTTAWGSARNLQIALASDGTPVTITVYMKENKEEPVDPNEGEPTNGSRIESMPVSSDNVVSANRITVAATSLDQRTGEAKALLDKDNILEARSNSQAGIQGGRLVIVDVPEIVGAVAYTVVIPPEFLTSYGAHDKLRIQTGIGTVEVPGHMLAATVIASATDVELTVEASAADEKPFLSLKAAVGGQKITAINPEAAIIVTIPYTPTSEELKAYEYIVVSYTAEDGRALPIPTGSYDESLGAVVLRTNQLGKYVVSYRVVNFDDITGYYWAAHSIRVLASKGIMSGEGEGGFKPAALIKRADFVDALVRALGITTTVDANFADIPDRSDYYNAVGIARKLGITKGIGGNSFKPDELISRQEMMVMVSRALAMDNKYRSDGINKELDAFKDIADIAPYAISEIAALVREGIVQGSDHAIHPHKPASRAEAAAIVYRLYDKLDITL
jgi:hypothetical protein